MNYRIKQVGNKFYPQYKKRFCWIYYKGRPYKDYGVFSFMTGEKYVTHYENLYFDSFEKANDFLINEKQSDMVTYHEIKN